MTPEQCLGHWASLLFLAVAADVIGLTLLFVGIFANVRLRGLFYGDFLIYTGAVIIFVSLVFWLMWYVGNIQVPEDYRGWEDRNSVVERLARKISRKMSQKPGRLQQGRAESAEDGGQSPTPHKASRVTWGKNSAYNNQGYDDALDSPGDEKKVEEDEKEEEKEGGQGDNGGEGKEQRI